MPLEKHNVVIVGAGPAGLTAALELIRHSDFKPIVIESLDDVGGISRTVEYHGNRMDIGGHRFFSKSDWVMAWWSSLIPPANPDEAGTDGDLLGHVPKRDRVMLVRQRLSRIYFMRKFFDYPVALSMQTIGNLGLPRMCAIGMSYIRARLFPISPETNLEAFFINRFGRRLYQTFFKDYTEKVWGVACRSISAAWGAQRIKGLSVTKAILHAIQRVWASQSSDGVSQKQTETSLIERFYYPKLGPGQMWRAAADELVEGGGTLLLRHTVTEIQWDGKAIQSLVARNDETGATQRIECDVLISTMPVKDLVASLTPQHFAPDLLEIAQGLMYRDFVTVGLLVKKLKASRYTKAGTAMNLVPDTWIYIQEPDVKIGRLQVFNNWSPALVNDQDTVWLGLEYFCFENDDLWRLSDDEMGQLAIRELASIDLIEASDALDFHVVRVPKAYPAYFGTYERMGELQEALGRIENLYPIGRNGMHRYNNQDHSMLTAKMAADIILGEKIDKSEIWSINAEDEYHETKRS